MSKIIEEGSARIRAFVESKISKELPVFYNPVMKLNRDISILLLNALGKKEMQVADPLAGSGIRGIRFLLELDKGIIKNISINDLSPNASRNIAENLKLNKIRPDKEKISITNEDANLFLLKSTGFDYIDIDPFGTPAPFLDAAINRISRDGILAVTATDTAALAGSSKSACLRKYWALPMRNELMHEVGIRILIRNVQLIGAAHEKALLPIFSYTDRHYYRIFFRCEKGKERADQILSEHKFLLYNHNTMERKLSGTALNRENVKNGWSYAGPIWTGQLWDNSLVKKMSRRCQKDNRDNIENRELADMLSVLEKESLKEIFGFYKIPELLRKNKTGNCPKIEVIISRLEKDGFFASRTIFEGDGIRTDAPIEKIESILCGK